MTSGWDPPWRAGLVMDILGLDRLSYQRLGQLASLTDELRRTDTRLSRPDQGQSWRMFSPADVARVGVVINACGGTSAFTTTSSGIRPRLRGFGKVRAAGQALMSDEYGLDDPLLQVPWVRQGKDVLVIMGGQLLDPVGNQVLADLIKPEGTVLGELLKRCEAPIRTSVLEQLRYDRPL